MSAVTSVTRRLVLGMSIRLLNHSVRDSGIRDGFTAARCGEQLPVEVRRARAQTRAVYGFDEVHAPLLTAGGANPKLGAMMMGLFLPSGPRWCPNMGVCGHICVTSKSQRAMIPSGMVPRAREARGLMLVRYPYEFGFLTGYELGRRVVRDGYVGFRGCGNHDEAGWERPYQELDGVQPYDYTKNPDVLRSDVDTGRHRVAFSWNEDADLVQVRDHLRRGGRVAVVTDRRKGQPILSDHLRSIFGDVDVMDADYDDMWMVPSTDRGLIGDLSLKGVYKDPHKRAWLEKAFDVGFVVSATRGRFAA